jgi:hypothetical protein
VLPFLARGAVVRQRRLLIYAVAHKASDKQAARWDQRKTIRRPDFLRSCAVL